jgi:mitotic spindle assembly checkpoint protein MAD2
LTARVRSAVAVDWLMVHALQKVVVVVTGVTTGETLERWAFDIEADKEVTADGGPVHEKPMKEITKEIQAIIRQITASVTFLPMLGAQRLVVAVSFISVLSHVRACARLCASDEPCAFEVLLYADQDATVADEWAETDAKFIANSEDMRLRSFSTKVHKVHSQVAYKVDDD